MRILILLYFCSLITSCVKEYTTEEYMAIANSKDGPLYCSTQRDDVTVHCYYRTPELLTHMRRANVNGGTSEDKTLTFVITFESPSIDFSSVSRRFNPTDMRVFTFNLSQKIGLVRSGNKTESLHATVIQNYGFAKSLSLQVVFEKPDNFSFSKSMLTIGEVGFNCGSFTLDLSNINPNSIKIKSRK